MATILKHSSSAAESSSQRPVQSLTGFNLRDFTEDGRTRLQEYERQANEMIANAQAEAARIRSEAQKRGYEHGLAQAKETIETKVRTEAQARSESGLDLVQSAVDQIHQTFNEWMRDYSEVMSTIAIAASERVLCRELQNDPELLVSWARNAVIKARSACRLTIAVHPKTLALVGDSLDQMLSGSDMPESVEVVADESLRETEVSVRQQGGEIQAGLIAQLRRLEELLS